MKIYFSENPHWKFEDLLLYPKKFRRKEAFTPGNSANLSDTPWKFQGQKPRPMEIPHQFSLNTPGISTSFLIDPWNFHVFFSRPPEIPCPQPPCLDFFWNSPILKVSHAMVCLVYLLSRLPHGHHIAS